MRLRTHGLQGFLFRVFSGSGFRGLVGFRGFLGSRVYRVYAEGAVLAV